MLQSLDVDEALVYLDFVQARHDVWRARQEGLPADRWTEDPILRERKFTNVFRVLDPGSQFALSLVNDPAIAGRDALTRAYLYRITNTPESWQALLDALGHYPRAKDLGLELTRLWMDIRASGVRTFSGAYVINQGVMTRGVDKLEILTGLAARFFRADSPEDLWPDFREVDTQADRHKILKRIPGINDFMALQILTDFGYSIFNTGASEDEFVVGGPGSIRGAAYLAPGDNPLDVIHWAHDALTAYAENVGDLSLPLEGGGRRTPSLMDAQNTLCEFSKYVRYRERPRTGKTYNPAHPGQQPEFRLPAHW